MTDTNGFHCFHCHLHIGEQWLSWADFIDAQTIVALCRWRMRCMANFFMFCTTPHIRFIPNVTWTVLKVAWFQSPLKLYVNVSETILQWKDSIKPSVRLSFVCIIFVSKGNPVFYYVLGFDAESVNISKFLGYDIKDKVIIAFSFTTLDLDEVIKFYKVTPRAQVRSYTGEECVFLSARKGPCLICGQCRSNVVCTFVEYTLQ